MTANEEYLAQAAAAEQDVREGKLPGRVLELTEAIRALAAARHETPASPPEPQVSDLDRDEDTGDAEEFERTGITVTPVTVEEMGLSAPAGPLICWTCSARVSWSGAGYFHTEDGWWPQGKPAHFTAEQFDLHTEGQRAEDGYVAVLPDPQRPPWAPPR